MNEKHHVQNMEEKNLNIPITYYVIKTKKKKL